MKPLNFKQRCEALAQESQDKLREDNYKQLIQDLLAELNDANTTRVEKLTVLRQLKATDKHYFEILRAPIEKEIFLTRHAHCSQKRKGYGLIPNTTVKESALAAMEQSYQYTEAMLDYSDLQIVVSPLTRALQTAGRLVSGHSNFISIDPVLTENSYAPSGCDIRNTEQLKEMYSSAYNPFMKFLFFFAKPSSSLTNKSKEELMHLRENTWNPFKLLQLYFAIHFYYSDKQLMEDRNHAIDALKEKSPDITDSDKEPESHRNVALTEEDKLQGIARLIQESQSTCLWLIGHGKNFRNFIMSLLGDDSIFDYTETCILYWITDTNSQEKRLVCPPYKLKFNQETGEVEGSYTGLIQRSKKPLSKVLSEQERTEEVSEPLNEPRDSHVVMHEQGLTASSLSKKADKPLPLPLPFESVTPLVDSPSEEVLQHSSVRCG